MKKLSYKLMRLLSRIPITRKIAIFISNLFYVKSRELDFFEEKVILIKNYNTKKILDELEKEGISQSIRLNKNTVDKILEYIKDKPVFALRDPKYGYYLKDQEMMEKKLGKQILLAQYNNMEDSDIFSEIVNSKFLLSIAKQYLGPSVKKVGAILWWTFPSNVSEEDRIKHAHFYHRDVDDYKFLKIFFYLTDLKTGDGTHIFVKTTHKAGYKEFFEEGLRVKRYSDEQIKYKYPEKIYEVLGNAGDGFFEDTFGFHKANTPIQNPRLAFEITYAINNYGVMNDNYLKHELYVHEF